MYPPFAIFILMYSTLLHLGFHMSHMSLKEGNYQQLFNLTVQLALTYFLICLTPYVDKQYYAAVGDAFMNVTYVLIGFNMLVSARS